MSLAGPAVVQADTIYFSKPGTHGIQTISGEIVQELGNVLEIVTEDGRTVSIPQTDVFQVVRDAPPAAGYMDADLANSRSAGATHVGIKGGMNISNMSVDPQELEDDGSLKSYAVGAWWGIPVNRRLTIQPEAFYSVRGDAETVDGYTTSTQMGYIDVPVLAKIGFMHGAPAQPSLFIGPSLAVNVSANSQLEGDGTDTEIDVADQVRAFDLGLVVGGGVDFVLGERTFGIDLRYSKGLSNIAGDGANGSARNDVIAIMGSIGLQ